METRKNGSEGIPNRFFLLVVLLGGIEAGTGLGRVKVSVAYHDGFGVLRLEMDNEAGE